MRTMPEEEKKQTNHYKIDNNSAEIPSLSMTITTYSAEFIREQIDLSASGWSVDEAIAGMEYLIDRIKEVKQHQEIKQDARG
jgi:hypothetical protein